MLSTLMNSVLVVACALGATAVAAPVPPPELAEAQLRAINHRFVGSFVDRDRDFMAGLVHADFVRTAGDGSWQDRAAFLAEFGQPSRMAGASYDDVSVRLFGNVAVTHAVFEALMNDGRVRKVRYTDVYVWDGAGWRLVSGQNSPFQADVPVGLQTGAAPRHAPWTGSDPQGEDLDVLRELNASYVEAFRNADVAWYAEHLAPDYVVVSGNGSIKDRAAALADFAQPVYAKHIASFPVDKVRIRRFDDIALIHAENDFTMKDGRVGVNRYTDIWRKDGGKWRCIAAHITVHKPLAQPG
jgi:uncharacterized protein (TIGR02246 family)